MISRITYHASRITHHASRFTLSSNGKRLSILLRIGVTVLGLAYVLSHVPLADIVAALGNVQWPWLLLAFALVNVSLVVRAYRWLLLLRGLGLDIPLVRLVKLYFVGYFFNSFLPSGFGGDVVRILEIGRSIPRSVAAGSVLVDRLTGLLALFAMALLALPFRPANFPTELAWTIVALCSGGLLAGFILLEGSLIGRFGRWLPARLSPTGTGPIGKLMQAVQGSRRRAVSGALAVSVLFNLIQIGWWTAVSLSLGYSVSYTYYLLVVPILSVALLVPSISGLGVRESIAPLLLTAAGLAQPQAVALTLLEFALLRLTGLAGAPVYVASTFRTVKKA